MRYAPLVSQRPKPSRVIGRMRAASVLSATTELVSSGGCKRCCEWCRERRGMCLSVRGTFLSIYTAVPVRLAALPDTLLSTYETNPGDLSPRPCIYSSIMINVHVSVVLCCAEAGARRFCTLCIVWCADLGLPDSAVAVRCGAGDRCCVLSRARSTLDRL